MFAHLQSFFWQVSSLRVEAGSHAGGADASEADVECGGEDVETLLRDVESSGEDVESVLRDVEFEVKDVSALKM